MKINTKNQKSYRVLKSTQLLSALSIAMFAFGLTGCNGDSGTSAQNSYSYSSSENNNRLSKIDGLVVDRTAYKTGPNDGLNSDEVNELNSVTSQVWTGPNNQQESYQTQTGHLVVPDARGNKEASIFYVAYTQKAKDGETRPVTFFYNGGPGSSSIWIRLGSYAPLRAQTNAPDFGSWPNYPEVNNIHSLIQNTDLVFIDPPGTGFSEAILPKTNKDFWGAKPDVLLFRDFIKHYNQVHSRQKDPTYIYGESYGGPRTAMLSLALENAGVNLAGIVAQSPIFNYYTGAPIMASQAGDSSGANTFSGDAVAGFLPSYIQVAKYYENNATDPQSYGLNVVQPFVEANYATLNQYGPAVELGIGNVLPNTTDLNNWETQLNLSTNINSLAYFLTQMESTAVVENWTKLKPNYIIGRYDGRVNLPASQVLASSIYNDHNYDPQTTDTDPSSIIITKPFTNILKTELPNILKYTAPNAQYNTLNDSIINNWDFSYEGLSAPDTIPDLTAAIEINPSLKVLVLHGWHDLATPYYNTQKDLARLQSVHWTMPPNVQIKEYTGGHMIYLTQDSLAEMSKDMKQYYSTTSGTIQGSQQLSDLKPTWPNELPANQN